MAGLPVVGGRPLLLQHRIGHEQAGRFDVDDEPGIVVHGGDVARQHDADLVGEDLVALIVDDAAAVAIAVEAKADRSAPVSRTLSRIAWSISMSSGLGL